MQGVLEGLKMRQQVSSLGCISLLLSCWTLSPRHRKHNHLNMDFQWKNECVLHWVPHLCKVDWICSFESQALSHGRWIFSFLSWMCLCMLLYVHAFLMSEIKHESFLLKDRLAFLSLQFLVVIQSDYASVYWLVPLGGNKSAFQGLYLK